MSFFNQASQNVLDELDENEIVVFADATGARLFSKIRGATAEEMGFMLGAAQASLQRQTATLRKHVLQSRGNDGASSFDRGLNQGKQKEPYNEGLGLREYPKPENNDG